MRASIFLILLVGTLWAITDCEICQIITPIYGACSPELVKLYANKTGLGPIEWRCMDETLPPRINDTAPSLNCTLAEYNSSTTFNIGTSVLKYSVCLPKNSTGYFIICDGYQVSILSSNLTKIFTPPVSRAITSHFISCLVYDHDNFKFLNTRASLNAK